MLHLITNSEIQEDGLEWIKKIYSTDFEVSGGECCDYLVGNLDEFFEKGIDKTAVMNAIQTFRSWDCEDDDEQIFQKTSTSWRYIHGGIPPAGIRVGVRFQKNILLDEGICEAE